VVGQQIGPTAAYFVAYVLRRKWKYRLHERGAAGSSEPGTTVSGLAVNQLQQTVVEHFFPEEIR
jgi:hypothetical protein